MVDESLFSLTDSTIFVEVDGQHFPKMNWKIFVLVDLWPLPFAILVVKWLGLAVIGCRCGCVWNCEFRPWNCHWKVVEEVDGVDVDDVVSVFLVFEVFWKDVRRHPNDPWDSLVVVVEMPKWKNLTWIFQW